jgi:hypothetical protein
MFTLNREKLKKLKNIYKGERCFILGNGPSIKKQDLSKLYNEHVFVCNWFVLKDEWKYLKKANLCISDAHFWNYGDGLHKKLVDSILKNTDARIFFEEDSIDSIRKESSLQNFDVAFLKCDRKVKLFKGEFEPDITNNLAWGLTVVLEFSFALAFYMGFDTVYILGCDSDYKLDKSKDFEESFCYNINEIPEKDLEYIKKQRDLHHAQEQLEIWLQGYSMMKKVFENEKKEIYNAGIGGCVNIFDRVSYDELFNKDHI